MICINCGNKITRTGKSLSRKYRHIFKDKYGNWSSAKSYKNCEDPTPEKY